MSIDPIITFKAGICDLDVRLIVLIDGEAVGSTTDIHPLGLCHPSRGGPEADPGIYLPLLGR